MDEKKEVCKFCVPYGWDDERIWITKLGRKFGISTVGLIWILFFLMIIVVVPKYTTFQSDPGWFIRFVNYAVFAVVLTIFAWIALLIPTWIYRALRVKRQAAFNLDKIKHIHDVDQAGTFSMGSTIKDRFYVQLVFGRRKKSAIIRYGAVDSEHVYLATSRREERMLYWRSVGSSRTVSSMEIKVSLEELLSLIDQGITRPSQLLARAVNYTDVSDENRELKQRVQALEGGGFHEKVALYLRGIIHDLKSSRRAHQSKVGERARVLLEAAIERLDLREANPDDQLGVIELETYIKQKSEVREPTNA